MIKVIIGDIFKSNAQTLVNTVNCVGVMGKGLALEFKKRFPDMFKDYYKRCKRGEVQLGKPYLYKGFVAPWILLFPTKQDWRSLSRIFDIERGLHYLELHYKNRGITSIAVPPLGCGLGELEWAIVGRTLYRHLKKLEIPVELYAPYGTPDNELTPDMFNTYKLVISRLVYDFEIEEGLNPIKGVEISSFDEKIPKITSFLDGVYKIKVRFGYDKKMFKEPSIENSINHFISYNYYDCMSGGCNIYILSIFRYVIENIEGFNLDEPIYPGKDRKGNCEDKNSWYNFHDFLQEIKHIERFEDMICGFQNQLPDVKKLLLEEFKGKD